MTTVATKADVDLAIDFITASLRCGLVACQNNSICITEGFVAAQPNYMPSS